MPLVQVTPTKKIKPIPDMPARTGQIDLSLAAKKGPVMMQTVAKAYAGTVKSVYKCEPFYPTVYTWIDKSYIVPDFPSIQSFVQAKG